MPELFYLDNFDQCLLGGDDAQYCTFTFVLKPYSNSSLKVWNIIKDTSSNPQNYRHDHLRHGICLQDTCNDYYNNSKPAKEIIETCYNEKFRKLNLMGSVANITCQSGTKRTYEIDAFDISFGVIMLLYILFVILASIYERYVLHDDKLHFYEKNCTKVGAFLAAFSVPRNWYRLRSTNNSPDHRKLRSIQGIRFYNMICVIMCHTVMGVLSGPVSNPQYVENSTKQVLNMFLTNGWYAVQSFFVISGWLLSYHFFDMASDMKKIKFTYLIWIMINRYIRLAPAVALMVAFHSTWLVHMSNGPNWDMYVGQEYRNCRNNWWTNILFINNYLHNHHMCLHHSWYIAADIQLFFFSTIVLYVVWHFPAKIKAVLGTLLLVGFLIPGIVAYINEYDIVIRQYPEVIYNLKVLKLDHWHKLYSSAYSNIFGYTIGITFGYLFYTYRNVDIRFGKVHIVFWWLLTFGMCISVVLVAVVFYDPDFYVTPLRSATYWSLGKNLFALGIAVGIFGFANKIGWFARWCCEFQPVQVLGRVTYSTYLVHVALIRFQMGYRRYPSSVDSTMLFFAVLGDVTCAYLVGTVLCLLVEMPVSALQKMFGMNLNRKRRAIKKSSEKSLETLDMTSDHIVSKH